MGDGKLSWRPLVVVTIVAIGLGLTFDVRSSGGLERSKTGAYLKKIGLLSHVQIATRSFLKYYQQFYDLAGKNVTKYGRLINEKAGPYLDVFWKRIATLSLTLWGYTLPARNLINKYVPFFFEQISEIYLPKALYLLRALWANISEGLLVAGSWAQDKVLTASGYSGSDLSTVAGDALESVQRVTTLTGKWISDLIK